MRTNSSFGSNVLWCSVTGKFCDCEPRCVDVGVEDFEQATYCGCDKGELTKQERETSRCQQCGKAL